MNRATSISNEGMGRPTAYQSKYVHSKRSHQHWYIKFTTTRGKKWLDTALEDKAFRLGFMGIKAVEPEPELLDYDWKALAKYVLRGHRAVHVADGVCVGECAVLLELSV